MKLGEIIKQYRQDRQLSLREFAKLCGTSHSYIAMLEDGKNSKTKEPIIPTIVTLKKISTVLNVSLHDLILSADDMTVTLGNNPEAENQLSGFSNLSNAELALLDLFRQIPVEHQEMVLGMIRAALSNLRPPKSQ